MNPPPSSIVKFMSCRAALAGASHFESDPSSAPRHTGGVMPSALYERTRVRPPGNGQHADHQGDRRNRDGDRAPKATPNTR
jgi:hypothetical protein